ncbi:MAG: ABC transporter substrate-binding protein [Chitinophagales bacterium]|nr:ABC transporter substrate-binding protein [Chitinophagales bacterium]
MNKQFNYLTGLGLLFAVFITGCGGGGQKDGATTNSKRAGKNEIIVHTGADAENLNPFTSSDATATEINNNMFFAMLTIDAKDYSLKPLLALARPTIEPIEDGELKGGLKITYEIRPEAKWDNGTPVLASDVEFSLKVIKNPQVDCEHLRGYYDFVRDMTIDPANPRKYTFFCKDRYLMSELSSGDIPIVPEYVYDPQKIMRKFSVKQLCDPKNTAGLKGNADIIAFAKEFNSEKFKREKGFVVGCGPYELVEWKTGQRIIIQKKKNWWGDALMEQFPVLNGYADKIVYEIIQDPTTMLTVLKDEGLDVSNTFKPKDFKELQDNKKMNELYNFYTPDYIVYTYYGLNMKNPKLADKKVRQALSHLVDRDYIIDKVLYNYSKPAIGPVHPTQSYYNKNLKQYEFNIELANKMLDEAGWKDTDNDGVRDKVINGKKIQLVLELKYPSASPTAEPIGLIFKNNAQKAGVKVELVSREWTVFLEDNKKHNFEMFTGSWVKNPGVPDDPYQIWHRNSYTGDGSNYVGFGTAESDALIDSIRYEMDETKRNAMYMRFQEIIHEEAPYIFLTNPVNKIAIHKRFDNAEGIVKRPGYEVRDFKLNPNFGKGEKMAAH